MSVSDLSMKFQSNLAFKPSSRPFFPLRDSGSPMCRFGTNTTSHGFGSYRKFSLGPSLPTPKLICQVCTRVGHSAAVFHYHFDRSFHTSPPHSLLLSFVNEMTLPLIMILRFT